MSDISMNSRDIPVEKLILYILLSGIRKDDIENLQCFIDNSYKCLFKSGEISNGHFVGVPLSDTKIHVSFDIDGNSDIVKKSIFNLEEYGDDIDSKENIDESIANINDIESDKCASIIKHVLSRGIAENHIHDFNFYVLDNMERMALGSSIIDINFKMYTNADEFRGMLL